LAGLFGFAAYCSSLRIAIRLAFVSILFRLRLLSAWVSGLDPIGCWEFVLWRRVARRWRQVSLLSDPAVHWFCHLDMDSVVSGSTVSRCDTIFWHHKVDLASDTDSAIVGCTQGGFETFGPFEILSADLACGLFGCLSSFYFRCRCRRKGPCWLWRD